MIVIDPSVLVAILRSESDADEYQAILEASSDTIIGAPSKFELLLVMGKAQSALGMAQARRLLGALAIRTFNYTDELADGAADAFLKFGKGRHKAELNFGDCMSYALAKSLDAPLLFKGNDFALTDVRSAA